MESSNFNLDQSIQAYIDVISNQGSITGSDAAELRDHLYDATADLIQNGLSTEEAFMIATKRLGNSELLTTEYGKVNVSLMTNKVWAYLITGFSFFYVLGFFLFTLIPIFYNLLIKSLNILLDATIGAIPILGQIFDFFFKANARNMKLMQEHYLENKHQGSGKKIVIWVLIVIFILLVALLYGIWKLAEWLGGMM